jgi:peptidoglycan-N-acetylglucosamine deacetylase
MNKKMVWIVAAVFLAVLVVGGFSTLAGTSKYSNKIISRFSTNQKVVFLTFDDGPFGSESTGYTRQIVDSLAAEGVNATFFLVGARAEQSPNSARYILAKGNEIALHSYDHKLMKTYTKAQCRDQVKRDIAVTRAITGKPSSWFRAPQGKVSKNCLAEISKTGLFYANWTGGTIDTNSKSSPAQITNLAMKYVRPGAIILLHETNPNTVAAVPQLIKRLKAKGYKIRTMSQMSGVKPAPKPTLMGQLPGLGLVDGGSQVIADPSDFVISSSTIFSFSKATIYGANGELVVDGVWVASAPESTHTFKISELSTMKLSPGNYSIVGSIMDINGQTAVTQSVPVTIAEPLTPGVPE